MRLRPTFLLFAILAGVVFLAGHGYAQKDRAAAIDATRNEISSLREAIDGNDIEDVAATEERLRELREEARKRFDDIDRELSTLNSQIEALGPAPGENDPPESDDLAAERQTLNDALAQFNSQKVRVNANIIETGDLLAQISTSRIRRLYNRLLSRGASPLTPSVWSQAVVGAKETSAQIGEYFSGWTADKEKDNSLAEAFGLIALAIGGAIFLFWPVRNWLFGTFSAVIEGREATSGRRVVFAGLSMLARAAPGILGGFIIIETLRAQGVLTEAGETPARALWFALIAYLLISGFLRGLLSPKNQAWRIAPVDAARGARISHLINAIVLVFGGKILLAAILKAADAAPALTGLLEAIVAIVISVLLFLLCRRRLWAGPAPEAAGDAPHEVGKPAGFHFWRLMRRLGRAFAFAIAAAALTGYVALADFAASRIYFLAIIIALAWFLRALLLEGASLLWRRQTNESRLVSHEETERRAANARFWNGLVINALLLIAAAPAVLVLIGTPRAAVQDFFGQLLFGYQVGGVHVPSLFRILVAIGVFVAIMGVTRIAQRGFKSGPFAHSQLDTGVQNSLITLVGYAGLLVALFASISMIGFDLSNLALIAGALSVGIGFGLQSIVNNFVSGLILLFERPIKAGDWVVTPSGEGTVRKISVRSTEIETFDRASIIVPNSELISQTVTNWTHKNKLGRITMPVGVAYGSDVEKIREILIKCADEHPLVVRYPEPFIVWQDFGASSLDFELRCYLADISNGLTARTELRFAIYKAFHDAGIEIPFPQRDIHVKSWPAAEPEQGGADQS